MSSMISFKEQHIYVSNKRFNSLIAFATEVGSNSATTQQENLYVSGLKEKSETFYPGYDFEIDNEMASLDERKFWSKIFFDVSYLIFERKIGNQNVSFWQPSAIGDAYVFARLLLNSIHDEEQGWHPKTLADLEADAVRQNGLNIQ